MLKRLSKFLIAGYCLGLIGGWAVYLVWRSEIIDSIYYKTAPKFLHSLISNTTGDPVDYYYQLADEKLLLFTNTSLAIIFSLGFLYFLANRKLLLPTLLSLLLVIGAYEGTIYYSLNNPTFSKSLPSPLFSQVRKAYIGKFRDVTMTNPQSYRYDPEVTYTLNPGEFIFKNVEFSNSFSVNSQGLRDDEEDLIAPEIIFLGDSFTMGWGVEKEDSYVDLLEKETSRKILNAGIASYGTVRALKLFNRLDSSNLEFVVIQYSSNDFTENYTFLNQRSLPITSKAKQKQYAQDYQESRSYFPAKFSLMLAKEVLGGVQEKQLSLFSSRLVPKATPQLEAKAFLFALSSSQLAKRNDLQIIVTSIEGYVGDARQFIAEVERQKKSDLYPPSIQSLVAIEVTEPLSEEHGFILDDHLNKSGQKIIAKQIVPIINKLTLAKKSQ